MAIGLWQWTQIGAAGLLLRDIGEGRAARGERLFVGVHTRLQKIDEWLLARVPRLRRWGWYASVKAVQGPKPG